MYSHTYRMYGACMSEENSDKKGRENEDEK